MTKPLSGLSHFQTLNKTWALLHTRGTVLMGTYPSPVTYVLKLVSLSVNVAPTSFSSVSLALFASHWPSTTLVLTV